MDILETLLRQPGHEDGLPDVDQPVALNMIEYSDNDAATDLWNAAGGPAGIGSY